MICPKCQAKNQGGNFCSNCGNPLREKCDECGKMEPIGRRVCETKLAEARRKVDEYISQAIKEVLLNAPILKLACRSMVSGTLLMIISIKLIDKYFNPTFSDSIWSGILLMIFFISQIVVGIIPFCIEFIFFVRRDKKCRKIYFEVYDKAKSEFLQKFPAEAEILKKAEGEKNARSS